jgi:glycosyltransferase involved in cell wall biosynthesis
MVTPKVDVKDAIFGFIPTWINKIAKKVEYIYVITIGYNESTPLRKNVEVYSLGDRLSTLSKLMRFNRIAIRLVRNVDVIFCHMMPIFTIISAPYAKIFRTPLVTWYAHGHVGMEMKIVHSLADRIVTSSEMGFRIKSKKVVVTGQGIDTTKFKPKQVSVPKKIVFSAGRISPVKDYETLIKAVDIIVNDRKINNIEVIIAGGLPAGTRDHYLGELKGMVGRLGLENKVKFVGRIPHSEIEEYYQRCRVFVSASRTGSLDKVVLEAMACEKPALTCNNAFLEVFDEDLKEKCYFREKDFTELADKIETLIYVDDAALKKKLRTIVERNHSVDSLVDKIIDVFKSATSKRW